MQKLPENERKKLMFVYLESDLAEHLEEIARRESRPISRQIVIAVKEYLKTHNEEPESKGE